MYHYIPQTDNRIFQFYGLYLHHFKLAAVLWLTVPPRDYESPNSSTHSYNKNISVSLKCFVNMHEMHLFWPDWQENMSLPSIRFKTHVTLEVLLPWQLTTLFSQSSYKRCPNFEIFANNWFRHSIQGSIQELYIAWALEHKNTPPSKHFRQTKHLATLLTIWLNFFHFLLTSLGSILFNPHDQRNPPPGFAPLTVVLQSVGTISNQRRNSY